MKRLVLIRHGKAEDLLSGGDDHSRQLTSKGREQATGLGRHLFQEKKWWPDLCLVSDAKRAMETHDLMFSNMPGVSTKHQFRSELYQCRVRDLEELVWGQEDSLGCLMMVGHNPTFSDFASNLLGALVELKTGEALGLESQNLSWASDPMPLWERGFSWRHF